MMSQKDLTFFINTLVDHHGSKDAAYLVICHGLHTVDPTESQDLEDVWRNLKAAHDILRPQTAYAD